MWSASRNVTLRSDWEKVKVRVMYTGNKAKFEQNEDLKYEELLMFELNPQRSSVEDQRKGFF